jgi:transcriptional regulator with XRE-family HTH domain
MLNQDRSVADLMREWRRTAGLSTTDVAAVTGKSVRTIEGIEGGRGKDDFFTVEALRSLIEKAKKKNQLA